MTDRLPVQRAAADDCAGCLGTRECWVCLGTGANDTQHGIGVCRSCEGRRDCQYCRPAVVQPATGSSSLTTG